MSPGVMYGMAAVVLLISAPIPTGTAKACFGLVAAVFVVGAEVCRRLDRMLGR